MDLRNNILIDKSVPSNYPAGSIIGKSVALARATTTLTNFATTSGNNIMYAGESSPRNAIYYDNTNLDITPCQFVARVTPRDTSDLSENTPFTSLLGSLSNFLRPLGSTFAEGRGSAIATPYNVDFDSVTRGTPRDIGAYEGSFTTKSLTASVTASANHLVKTTGPGVNNQVILRVKVSSTGKGCNNLTKIALSTAGTTDVTNISAARLYYTNSSEAFDKTSLFGSGVANPSGTIYFNGTQALGEGNNYFWLVYDIKCAA